VCSLTHYKEYMDASTRSGQNDRRRQYQQFVLAAQFLLRRQWALHHSKDHRLAYGCGVRDAHEESRLATSHIDGGNLLRNRMSAQNTHIRSASLFSGRCAEPHYEEVREATRSQFHTTGVFSLSECHVWRTEEAPGHEMDLLAHTYAKSLGDGCVLRKALLEPIHTDPHWNRRNTFLQLVL